jgi:hypothetical protein
MPYKDNTGLVAFVLKENCLIEIYFPLYPNLTHFINLKKYKVFKFFSSFLNYHASIWEDFIVIIPYICTVYFEWVHPSTIFTVPLLPFPLPSNSVWWVSLCCLDIKKLEFKYWLILSSFFYPKQKNQEENTISLFDSFFSVCLSPFFLSVAKGLKQKWSYMISSSQKGSWFYPSH